MDLPKPIVLSLCGGRQARLIAAFAYQPAVLPGKHPPEVTFVAMVGILLSVHLPDMRYDVTGCGPKPGGVSNVNIIDGNAGLW
jgi:hypothetical protein